MNKRTNISNKVSNFFIKSIIPLLLILSCAIPGDTQSVLKTVLNLSSFIAYPIETIKGFYASEKTIVEENAIIETMGETHNETQKITIESDISNEIIKLIKEAETTLANSSNDGKILNEDYSRKNATAEYDKILFRNTTIDKTINIEEYLNKSITLNISKKQPTVLIYHTHTSEAYELLDRGFYSSSRDVRSSNKKETVVQIGEEICKALNKKGYETIHITDTFDEQYSGAYERSREKISEVLKSNPSIQVVLDVHRDSIYQKEGARIKTTTMIDNKNVAQIMITAGCETGNVSDFPNWEKNLTFALHLQNQLAKDNPKIVRPLMFSSRKYNMDLLPCALSIDIGTDANTLIEAIYSARYFAESLATLLKENEKND